VRSGEMRFASDRFPAVAVAHEVALLHAGKLWTASRKANLERAADIYRSETD
jgi:hypothetical protein